jgi:hypothetical protein
VLIRPWEKLVLGQKYNEVLPFTLHANTFNLIKYYPFLSLFAAWCRPFRSRFTSDHDVSFFADRLWRRARKVCANTADRYAAQPRSGAFLVLDLFLFVVICEFLMTSLGGRCGRILQWFWDHVEVERAGRADSRWTQAINYLSTTLPLPLKV